VHAVARREWLPSKLPPSICRENLSTASLPRNFPVQLIEIPVPSAQNPPL